MHDDQPPARSPFMMSPSARPPSVEEARVVVRVPPPPGAPGAMNPQDFAGTPMYGSAPPGMYPSQPPAMQQGYDPSFQHASTMMAPPGQPLAMGALPPEEKKKISPIPIVAVVLAAAVLAAVFLFGNKQPPPAPVPDPAAAAGAAGAAGTAPGTPPAAVSPPGTVATVAPPPVPQVLGATSAVPAAPKPFDANAARAALDAAPDLSTCKLPKGKTCKLTVTFGADGTVKAAKAERPCAGSPAATCITNALKKASVAPFTGTPGPLTYSYTSKK
jgi:hypothetical protein